MGDRIENEDFTIVAATPPAGYPHDTAQAEVARLGEWLSVQHTYPAGTQRIITDSNERGDNEEKVWVERDVDGKIVSIRSHTNNKWERWELSADDLSDGSVTTSKLADDAVTTAKLADDSVGASELAASGAGDGLEQLDSGAYGVNVDGTTIKIESGELTVPSSEVSLNAPRITDQIYLNEGTDPALNIGSNGTSALGDAHGWIASWNGWPIDLFVTKDGRVGQFRFTSDDGFENRRKVGEDEGIYRQSVDTSGNVTHYNLRGSAQNTVWQSNRLLSGGTPVQAMMLESSTAHLHIAGALNAVLPEYAGSGAIPAGKAKGMLWCDTSDNDTVKMLRIAT